MAASAEKINTRFWSRVDKSGDCWIWQGGVNKAGYGRVNNAGVTTLAHRYAYEQSVGAIPSGLCVLHACDTTGCVNPSHLWPGTHAENQLDKVAKGRHHQQLKTRCPQGHEYTPENQIKSMLPRRTCKTCWYARNAVYRAKKRAEKI